MIRAIVNILWSNPGRLAKAVVPWKHKISAIRFNVKPMRGNKTRGRIRVLPIFLNEGSVRFYGLDY